MAPRLRFGPGFSSEGAFVALPKVAIVGRPNVGKSSVFNWLAERRIAIVDPTPGVTRDRLSTIIEANGRFFDLIDTGGMGVLDADNLTAEVEQQIALALIEAHLLLFVVDVRDGIAPLDELVTERLRTLRTADGKAKQILCVVNKCDSPELDSQAGEFFKLGAEQMVCVSAKHNRGKTELLDWITAHLPTKHEETPADVALKLAIVGRRNTGKSTFINCLAQEERVIVSEVPGTTRDSVDIHFQRDGLEFIAIDTAGVRKKKSLASDVEFYSLARAERSIRRADVVLLFLDSAHSISQVDKQLAAYILEENKPAILVVNKWDLMKGQIVTGEFGDYLHKVFPSLDYLPVVFITAKDGKNVQMVLNLAQHLQKQASARVGTGELNRLVRLAISQQAPPTRQNRLPRIYYATQAAVSPPTIVLVTNGPELFDNTYQRFLLKTFREHLPFAEVPIKLVLRRRNRGERLVNEDPTQELPMKKRTVARPKKKPQRKKDATPELWQD